MKRTCLVAYFLSTFFLYAQTEFTHNTNHNIWNSGSAACTTPGPLTIHDNSFIRVFETNDFGIMDTAFFVYIQMGIQTTSGGAYDITGRIHKLHDTLLFANMTLLAADTAAVFADSAIYKMKIPIKDGYALPGDTLVTEVFAPVSPVVVFYPGTNPYAETSPSYIAAAGCGLLEPTEYSAIGYPNAHLALNLWVNQKPSMADLSLSVFKNNMLDFQKADFDAAWMDHDNDTLHFIRIETLPPAGNLELNGVAVNAGDTIYSAELATLSYTPLANYVGNDIFKVRVKDGYHWANNTTQVNLTVFDWAVGIEEKNGAAFSMYPNPGSAVITVSSDEKIQEIRVFDSKGSNLRINAQNNQFDISELPAGTYFVVVTTETGTTVEKLVKN